MKLPGALFHPSPCSEELYWGNGETAGLERVEEGRRKREQCAPEKKQQWPCLLPGDLESWQIKSGGKAKVIINPSTLESYY